MIDFAIEIISFTVQRIEETKSDLSRINSCIYDIYSELYSKLDSEIMHVEGYVWTAERDYNLAVEAIAKNNYSLSTVNHSIIKAREELGRVSSGEAPNESEISRVKSLISELESLQAAIRSALQNLETLRFQTSVCLDKLKSRLSKLKKIKDNFSREFFRTQSIVNDAEKILESARKTCKNALSSVEGIFTSCKIRGPEVLQEYRDSLKGKMRHLVQNISSFQNSINAYRQDIVGVEFVEQTANESESALMVFIANKEKLEKNIKKLDDYIIALTRYLKS